MKSAPSTVKPFAVPLWSTVIFCSRGGEFLYQLRGEKWQRLRRGHSNDGASSKKKKDAFVAKLLKLAAKDPALKEMLAKLSDAQKKQLYGILADPNSKHVEDLADFALPVLGKKKFGKDWMIIGPSDQLNPLNAGKFANRPMTYNCAGLVLLWYGKKELKIGENNRQVIKLAQSCWPDGVGSNYVDFKMYNQILKNDWDPFFKTLGKTRFKRMKWSPDFANIDKVNKTKLPKFKPNKNYIILMGHLNEKNGKIIQVQFSHVFTNYDSEHKWWISKLAQHDTVLCNSPTAFVGTKDDEDYGSILAIWESE
jgi:hypothetical protein